MKRFLLALLVLVMTLSLTFTLASCMSNEKEPDAGQEENNGTAPETPNDPETPNEPETPDDPEKPHTHTPAEAVKENEIFATCTADGSYDEVVYCSDESCKAEISRTAKVIKSEGHNFAHGFCTVCTQPDPDYTPELKYSEGLDYWLSSDGTYYAVTGIGTCTDTVIVIPDTYNAKPVTEISFGAFANSTGSPNFSHSFYIPHSVTNILVGAASMHPFIGGTTYIEVDKNNPSYKSVDGNLYTKDGKTLVAYPNQNYNESFIIPDGVTTIGYGAFWLVSGLKNITIPATVAEIQMGAFECSLSTVYYEGSEADWANISIDLTYYNSYLINATRYYYSETAPTTGGNFWHYVEGVPTVWDAYVAPENPGYSVGLEYTSNGDGTCYVSGIGNCTDTEIIFPKTSPEGDKVTSVAARAFSDCKSITSVVIHDEITSIGNYAFDGCNNLVSVTIGNGLTKIGECVFAFCTGLTSFVIPSSVTSIGYGAFSSCSNLESIQIPDSVISIENTAFDYCPKLVFNTYGNCNYLGNGNNPYHALFYADRASEEYEIHADTKIIVSKAFSYLDKLTSIIIPNGVTHIGLLAFVYCENLTSIVIPDSVTDIDEFFVSCPNITYNTYENCKYLGNDVNPYVVLIEAVGDEYNSYEIHPNTKIIYSNAFSGRSNLVSIVIPDEVVSIGREAFYQCPNLSSVAIGNSVTSIGYGAFQDCSSLSDVEISDNVTSIGAWAFSGCLSLTTLEIPDSVTSIGNNCFTDSSNLENVKLSSSLTAIDLSLFSGCATLISITIPDGVTSIYLGAFSECSSLISVVIPESVTNIGFGAFYGCSSLTDVYYTGTEAEWGAIVIGSYGNDELTNATIHYNCALQE